MATEQQKDEIARLRYLKWQDTYVSEKPYQVFSPVAKGSFPRSNLVFEDGPEETIHDARGHEAFFDMDKHGFTFTGLEVDKNLFKNHSMIESEYIPRIEKLILQSLQSVNQVLIFDWKIRRSWTTESGIINAHDKTTHLLPSKHVHLDQHPSIVPQIVRRHLPAQSEDLLRGRVRVINAWKPLVDVVTDSPLTVCDGSTIQGSDIVAADHITQHHFDVNSFGLYRPGYRWWYLSYMRGDEVLLFKNFDSDKDISAKYCLHTSFSPIKTETEIQSRRESIEVRALVFS